MDDLKTVPKDANALGFPWLLTIMFICLISGVLLIFDGKESFFKTSSFKIDSVEEMKKTEAKIIRLDLDEYSYLSTRIKDDIIEGIYATSKKYNIPMYLLHTVFQIESDYRFNVDHPNVVVTVRNYAGTGKEKKIKTHAIGLGGVIWDFWSEKLKKAGVAEVESDLYVPKCNIDATGFILKEIIKEELVKNSNMSIVERIVIRYYGGPSNYDEKLKIVGSKLWLKRMTRELLDLKNEEKKLSVTTK